jgi:hypothetical protein
MTVQQNSYDTRDNIVADCCFVLISTFNFNILMKFSALLQLIVSCHSLASGQASHTNIANHRYTIHRTQKLEVSDKYSNNTHVHRDNIIIK